MRHGSGLFRAGFQRNWLIVILIGILSVSLACGTNTPVARAESPSPSPAESSASPSKSPVTAADSDGDGKPDRPDTVSAGTTARLLGVAVEDLSARTEYTGAP